MADAAVEFLLNNLKELLVHRSHLISDARNQIESLETDFRLLNAFLKDSVNRRRTEEYTKVLVRSIRDVAYEVEDVIDSFVTSKVMDTRSYTDSLRFWESPIDLSNIARKVMEVKERVACARDELRMLGVDDDNSQTPEVRPPREKDLVGFTDVTEKLINRLTTDTDYSDVVSLTGMLGLGKTTLAWKVFNDPAVALEFPTRIWLSISQVFSDKEIFEAILREVTTLPADDVISRKTVEELARMAAAGLEGKRFLLVMDDVWSRADWDRLRKAVPHDNKRGKILITSRDENVGRYASTPRPSLQLRLFKDEESWELLCLEALRQRVCPEELREIGKKIAVDCKGLPLAVVVIGGILATMFLPFNLSVTRRNWEHVSERVSLYFNDDPGDRMRKFISLSYDKLPYHLRACFLYLGMFPEDYEIPTSKLICMWIGEGFIQQNNDFRLEEIAYRYLEELINRNLVRIEKFKPDGKVKTCKIHDTLRDFCRIEAGNQNENFLQEIKYDGGFIPRLSDLSHCRRLSIHSNCAEFISSELTCPHVRSFVSLSKDEFILPSVNISNIFKAFKLLRVLDVKPIKFTKMSNYMYKLVHLRYILLSFNLDFLPSTFSQLWNIQTLIVDTTSRKLKVKADLWKMKQLRHFKTNASAALPVPSNDDHDTELQTLGTISVESCSADILRLGKNLKKLGIRGRLALLLDGPAALFDSLGQMRYLEKMKLINDVHPSPRSQGRLNGLPNPYKFPPKLRSLTLVATLLSWQSMAILGLLEKLEVLKIKDMAFTGTTWQADDGGFRHLEFLHIEHTDLAIWDASSHHFPRLRGLVLKNCGDLVEIPIGLADIASLQMLDLHNTSVSAVASARNIQVAKRQTQPQGPIFKLFVFPPTQNLS